MVAVRYQSDKASDESTEGLGADFAAPFSVMLYLGFPSLTPGDWHGQIWLVQGDCTWQKPDQILPVLRLYCNSIDRQTPRM